jgi:hypothetical protein
VVPERFAVEEHCEDDDDNDEEEEGEDNDGDVGHDLDAAVPHLNDLVAVVSAPTPSATVTQGFFNVQRILK